MLLLAIALYLGWVLLWQYSKFVGGEFSYHDLTIISDFFSNALIHGRPFWVTDEQRSHLRLHFTPSLLLWVPAFLFAKTQFALIGVVAASVAAGLFITVRDQYLCLSRAGVFLGWKILLVVSCFVAFAFNQFTLRVLSSAHFEPLFLFTTSLLLFAVRRGLGYRILLPLVLLAIGIRQDAGFFVFFLLVSCLVAPRAWGCVAKKKLLIAACLCVAYVVVASEVILPSYGNDGDTRFWREWGDTWPQVFSAWIRDPARVIDAVFASEFARFNAEFHYLPMLNPVAWAINQAPAVLFYTANSYDKRHLLFYNSAFLLPGLMLCFVFAQLHLVTLVMRHVRSAFYQHVLFAVVALICVCIAGAAALRTPRKIDEKVRVESLQRTDVFAQPPLSTLLACRNVHSVATDFRNMVYAPFRLDKYMLTHAGQSDLVVVARHLRPDTPLFVTPADVVHDLTRDGHYVSAGSYNDFDFYLRTGVSCAADAR